MKRDAFYFFHDSNAKDDPKCSTLIEELGCEGYGVFWILIEILREQPEYKYPLSLIDSIARKYNTKPDIVRSVISNFNLFEIEKQHFFSTGLNRRMEPLQRRREQTAEAGRKSAEARQIKAYTTLAQTSSNERSDDSSTDGHIKEKKREEKKRVEKSRKEKSREEKKREDILSALSASLREAVEDFIDHRQSIKAPMSERAIKLLLTELDKLTEDESVKIAILNQSVINGWKGVFVLRDSQSFVDSKGHKMSEAERIMGL